MDYYWELYTSKLINHINQLEYEVAMETFWLVKSCSRAQKLPGKVVPATNWGWEVTETVLRVVPATFWGSNVPGATCKLHPDTIWG